ncbi:COBW domain-containing protein 1, putative [Plasmodium ovale]|uniref:COBW domain-containing protein 1, putative n=2 Tax=Plasmodium ovale TaxID=36330 RepID=A0A1D3TN03_PLAOA|nr:COBW domain-containing protein 1, putative (CBWD1) [Plasmodium ovale curtisi]SBS97804.1 COBW domain-containing protein 1, putative (CBWD1) [Plasmodium ovale curtisi]SCP06354.1 COBW domain-containing protein 1, putative [Plasmodium ovale]
MIGVTIITGFLGSGKTTLLKNLLKESIKKNKKIAIIHNEFTENNNNIDRIVFKDINDIYNLPKEIDAKHSSTLTHTNEKVDNLKIVNEIESEEGFIYELNNGCLCCSNKSNFVKLIENILSMKTSYDSIFVEVSGVYDNIQINNLLWLDELNNSEIYLDSIVHIIDSYNFLNSLTSDIPFYDNLMAQASNFCTEERREGKVDNIDRRGTLPLSPPHDSQSVGREEEQACEQLIVCDVILLNKIDKISEHEKEKIKKFVANINPLSSIYLTTYSEMPIENITNLKCYEKKNIKNVFINTIKDENIEKKKKSFHYNNFVNCSFHFKHSILYIINLSKQLCKKKNKFLASKDKDILRNIFFLKKKNIFSYKKINDTLASLLWNNSLQIYRGKGIFIAFNDDIYNNKKKLKLNMYYYQSVGDLYEINLIMSDIHVFFRDFRETRAYHRGERPLDLLPDGSPIMSSAMKGIPSTDNKLLPSSDSNGECADDPPNENCLYNAENFLAEMDNYLSDDSSHSDSADYNVRNILNNVDIFESRFLFIGKNINVESVRKKLNECLCD